MKTMTMVALAAAIAAPALEAQVAVDARTSGRVHAETESREQQGRAGADAEVRLAARAGLPEEPVARAASRARARGRSEAEAARAAAETRGQLEASHEAIVSAGRDASDAEVTAGAEAMAAGAAQADLARIADSAPEERSLTASFRALTRLGARDGDFSEAATAIATRLEGGSSDRAITRLAATGNVDAMLRGSTRGLDAGANAAGGVTAGAGSVLDTGIRATGSITGGLGGGIIP